jgi:hypothetical protein
LEPIAVEKMDSNKLKRCKKMDTLIIMCIAVIFWVIYMSTRYKKNQHCVVHSSEMEKAKIASRGVYYFILSEFYYNDKNFGKTILYFTRSAICFAYVSDNKKLTTLVKYLLKLRLNFFKIYQHGSLSLLEYLRARDIQIPKFKHANEFFTLAEILIEDCPWLAVKYYAKSFRLYSNNFRRLSSLLKYISTLMGVFAKLIEDDVTILIEDDGIKTSKVRRKVPRIQILDKPKCQKEKSRVITCPKCGANEFEEKHMFYTCCYCNSSWFKKPDCSVFPKGCIFNKSKFTLYYGTDVPNY